MGATGADAPTDRPGPLSRLRVALMITTAALLVLPCCHGSAQPVAARSKRLAATATTPFFDSTLLDDLAWPTNDESRPLIGHFTDLALDDVVWYTPGKPAELLWKPCTGCSDGLIAPSRLQQQVAGRYEPIVGDFAGSAHDDILWWAATSGGNPSTAMDYLWVSDGTGTFVSTPLDVAAGAWEPILLRDSNHGPGKDDILWRARHRTSPLWEFPDDGSGAVRTTARLHVPPGASIAGDFDGNGRVDVLFYDTCDFMLCDEPGSPPDALWRRTAGAGTPFTTTALNVRGTYRPLVGQFSRSGEDQDDILWVGFRPHYRGQDEDRPDYLWEGHTDGEFTSKGARIPFVWAGVLGHEGADRATDADYSLVWRDTTSGVGPVPTGASVGQARFDSLYSLLIGHFTTSDREDVLLIGEPPMLWHPVS